MAVCEHCGNDYDKSFWVVISGKTHNFDSALAPSCAHRGVRIVATDWRRTAHATVATTSAERKE